jgi:hypothetical protein
VTAAEITLPGPAAAATTLVTAEASGRPQERKGQPQSRTLNLRELVTQRVAVRSAGEETGRGVDAYCGAWSPGVCACRRAA